MHYCDVSGLQLQLQQHALTRTHRCHCSRGHQVAQIGPCPPQVHEDYLPTVDPVLLKRYHLTDRDEMVRAKDCPERIFEALEGIPKFTYDRAAQYVYDALFSRDASGSLVKVRSFTDTTSGIIAVPERRAFVSAPE
jgi:hypothetical protein